jgi:uncharacterized protein with GYD domain
MCRNTLFSLLLLWICGGWLSASAAPQATTPGDYILLTVFLKHDQSKTLDEINQQLKASGFWQAFPPAGIEVESWYVMMGIGQVVTLRVPPQRLREVNLAIEKHAWGAFRTEFYPSYDFRAIAARLRERHSETP